MDRKWWTVMRSEAKSFRGQKYSSVGNIPGVKMTPAEPKGFNSGAGAILLAQSLGAERVILLGYDCKEGVGGLRHWHGKHRDGLKDAESLPKFVSQFERMARNVSRLDIVNCTRDTALPIWPLGNLEDQLYG